MLDRLSTRLSQMACAVRQIVDWLSIMTSAQHRSFGTDIIYRQAYALIDILQRIKGDEFKPKSLLLGKSTDTVAQTPASGTSYDPSAFPIDDASLAIFRLAPADYHRFHCPVDGEIVAGPIDISG